MTMSGVPGAGDTGVLPLRLTAKDVSGNATIIDYMLEIANINQAPVLSQAPSNQSAFEASSFALRIADAFFERDAGDVLSYTLALALADGPLPAWLQFDAACMTLSGTPGNGDTGVHNLRLTATDNGGLYTSTGFTLTVADVNQAPVLLHSVADQLAVEASGFFLTTVMSSISYASGSNVERLTLLGNSAINATGNSLNNILTGNSDANVIDGGLATIRWWAGRVTTPMWWAAPATS